MVGENKIKILYLISGLGSGGTERQLSELLLNLDRNIIQPCLAYYRPDDFYLKTLRESGLQIFYLPKRVRDKFIIWRIFGFVNSLAGIVRNQEIDLIHSFGPNANFWARIVGKLTGKKVIISVRSINFENETGPIKAIVLKYASAWYLLEKLIANWSTRVIVNSTAIKRVYCERTAFPEASVRVVRNGFNFKKIEPLENSTKNELRNKLHLPQTKFIILAVGRLNSIKNQLCLLRAVKILRDQGMVDFLVLLAGNSQTTYRQVLNRFLVVEKLSDCVNFLGERNDIYALIKAADSLVLPSFWEGSPNAVLEAMAIGTPVIVSDFDGVSDLIEDSRSGLLFPVNDDKALAGKIKSLRVMAVFEKKLMTEKAKEYVRNNFSSKRMVADTTGVYLELIRTK